MGESTHTAGIRIGGDASGAVEATREVVEEQKKLREETRRTGDQAKRSAEEARRYVDNLKDQTGVLGKTRAEAERYRASQLQLTEAQRQSVASSIRQIEAYDKKQQMLQHVRRWAAAAGVAIVALGTATVVAARSAINEADSLAKLSQSLAMSTEGLSAYRHQMQLAGVSSQEFGVGMRTLAQRVAQAQAGVGEGVEAFRVLGPAVEQAARRGAPLAELMPLIADAFAGFNDSTNKTATSVMLFGEAGAKLIPMLNAGSRGIREAREEAVRLGVAIDADFARGAENFNANMLRVNASFTALKHGITRDALPWLNRMIEQMLEGTRIAGGFGTAIRRFGTMSTNPAQEIRDADATIALLTESLESAPSSLRGYLERDIAHAKERRQFAQFLQRQQALGALEGVDTSDQNSRLAARLARGADMASPRSGGTATGMSPEEAAELARKAMADAIMVTHANAVAWIEAGQQIERASAEGAQQFSDQLNAPLVEAAELAVELGESMVYTWDATGKRVVMTREEYERLNTTLEKTGATVRSQVDESAREAQAAWERTADNIERSLTDAIVRGGQSGLEYLKAALRTAILTPVVQPIVRPVAGAVSSVVHGVSAGLFGGAPGYAGGMFGAGGGGGLGGILNMGGIAGMGQLGADFGNFFGSIGSVTEAGGTFGLSDAIGGFAGAHPWVPYLGAGMQLLSGDTRGAALSAGLTFAGGALLGPLGAVGGAVLGGLLGGRKKRRPAPRLAMYQRGFGEQAAVGRSLNYATVQMQPHLDAFDAAGYAQEQNLIRNLGLSGADQARVNQALQPLAGKQYNYGLHGTDPRQSGAFEQIQADRLRAISETLGFSIENLTRAMSMSVEQWEAAQHQLMRSASEFAAQVKSSLGIDALERFSDSLATSPYASPLERVAAARAQVQTLYGRAAEGDTAASNALPQAFSTALQVGREVYASGPEFAALHADIERMASEHLSRQRGIADDILADIPATVIQAGNDTVAALKRLGETLGEQLAGMRLELRRIGSS